MNGSKVDYRELHPKCGIVPALPHLNDNLSKILITSLKSEIQICVFIAWE